MVSRTQLLALLAALALFASACGSSEVSTGDDEQADDTAGETATDDESATDDVEPTDGSGGAPDAINGGKPEVEIAGESPSELQTDDLIDGDGDEAATGDLLEMHYVGVLFDDGSQFDASWDRDQTFSFVLGNGNVISGWDQGIVGMAVGGRRQLTIPAEFAYGDNSPSPAIPPGSTLVFVVDLVAAHSPHEVDTAVGETSALDVTTVTEGNGAEVAAGNTVEVLYSIAEVDGLVRQSSWTDGSTATFLVGADQLEIFPGWSEPLVGRSVGDELRIVVPPALGPNPESAETIVTQLTILRIVEP